jgi:hypothetical protein
MKKGTSRTYLYLLMVLLVGLILAGFIQPLMEGFREGVGLSTNGQTCNVDGDCVSGLKCKPTPIQRGFTKSPTIKKLCSA